MSRIGKKPIAVPKGVTIKVLDGAIEVKGPKGSMRQALPRGISFAVEGEELPPEPPEITPSSAIEISSKLNWS